jgi:hypothetical protein
VAVAQKQKKTPEKLAQQVLRDYVQQFKDEELLERSSAAARRAPFRMDETENVVRRYRRKNAR